VRCYYCNKFGHYACDCKKRIVDQGKKRDNVIKENNDSMFLAYHTIHEPFDNVWLLDKGFHNHMTRNKNLIANYDEPAKTKVKLGLTRLWM